MLLRPQHRVTIGPVPGDHATAMPVARRACVARGGVAPLTALLLALGDIGSPSLAVLLQRLEGHRHGQPCLLTSGQEHIHGHRQARHVHSVESFSPFSNAEFTITESELSAIAAAAIMGLSKPSAATGMPTVL